MSYYTFEQNRIYYEMLGSGEPVMLLHGDSASSKMFELLIPLYQQDIQLILLDFLGNGTSDRVEHLPEDVYAWEAEQVISLVEHLNLPKVSLVGTSGGAWVAIDAALKRPDLFKKVVADSFDGRCFADDFAISLVEERTFAMEDKLARQFYEWCQGEDWKSVVEYNTKALLHLANKPYLFCQPISQLSVPCLLIGSKKDTMCRRDMEEEYQTLAQEIQNATIHMFEDGDHPTILTNAEEFARIVKQFLFESAVIGIN